MSDQAFHSTEGFSENEDPRLFHEAASSLRVAQIERNHSAEARHLPAGELMLWVGRKSRIVNFGDCTLMSQPFGYPASVDVVLTHPKRKGLDTPQSQPAVHWSWHSTRGVLNKSQTLRQIIPPCHQQPADHVTVAIQILGGGVQYDVGAVLQRPLEEGSG